MSEASQEEPSETKPTAASTTGEQEVPWNVPAEAIEDLEKAKTTSTQWKVTVNANDFTIGSDGNKKARPKSHKGADVTPFLPTTDLKRGDNKSVKPKAAVSDQTKALKDKKNRTSGGKKGKTYESKSKDTAENVWNKAKDVLLQKRIDDLPANPDYPDEIKYTAQYKCARKECRTVEDGYQRKLTSLEEETLWLWRSKKVHLEEPPKYIVATHSLEERLSIRQTHKDHMGYRLYVQTPPQLKWNAETAKYHFCASLLSMNQTGGAPTQEALKLIQDVHLFTCSAESRLAVLRFVRPETRDKWKNKTFKFAYGSIRLRATDTFEQEDKKKGLDQAALRMLYAVHLLGKPQLTYATILAIAKEIGGRTPILDIKAIEPTGTKALDPHVWCILFNSITAPSNVTNVRFLRVNQSENEFTIGVYQPRIDERHPCPTCLSTKHFRNKCPMWKGTRENIEAERAPFERTVTIPTTASYEVEPTAATLEEHRAQMMRMRKAMAPGLSHREEHESEKAQASKGTPKHENGEVSEDKVEKETQSKKSGGLTRA